MKHPGSKTDVWPGLILAWAVVIILTAMAGWAGADSGASEPTGPPPAESSALSAASGPEEPAAGPDLPPLFLEALPEPASGLNMGWEMVKTALALILVVGLIIFGLKAGARLGPLKRRAGAGRFKLEAVMPLDNRKYLAAVEVDGRRLILGVTPERVNLLASWPASGFEALLPSDQSPGRPGTNPGEEEQLEQMR